MRTSNLLSLIGLVSLGAAIPLQVGGNALIQRTDAVQDDNSALIQRTDVVTPRANPPIHVDSDVDPGVSDLDDLNRKYHFSGNMYPKWHPNKAVFTQKLVLHGISLLLQFWVDESNQVHWLLDQAFPSAATAVYLGLTDHAAGWTKLPFNMVFGQEYVSDPIKGVKPADAWKFFW